MEGVGNPSQCQSSSCIHRVPLPEKLYAQLHARLTLKIDEHPIEPKASHLMKIMGSHRYILASNMEGVGSVPTPLSHALH